MAFGVVMPSQCCDVRAPPRTPTALGQDMEWMAHSRSACWS